MQLFREALLTRDFQEIHTPKLIAGEPAGTAALADKVACLQQWWQRASLAAAEIAYAAGSCGLKLIAGDTRTHTYFSRCL